MLCRQSTAPDTRAYPLTPESFWGHKHTSAQAQIAMRVSYAIVTLPFLAALACGQRASQSEPKAPVAPITITGDLENIDFCRAIRRARFEYREPEL